MFVNFFFLLRKRGIPVSTNEFFDLLDGLKIGLADTNLETFYTFARCVLVKDIKYFDAYDMAFAEFFHDIDWDPSLLNRIDDELRHWIQNPVTPREFSDEKRAAIKTLDFDQLRDQFLKRLQDQTERHDRGSHWIGTGGTSPFGHAGYNPAGIRVGGPGRNQSAVQVAEKRRFRNLRTDLTLDIRQFQNALKQLRVLSRDDGPIVLDLDASIEKTAKNAGDIELVFARERKNRIKLLLLMDVGGSMDPYAQLCSMLFSAAHQMTHFKTFKTYYFHNSPYEFLYTDISRGDTIDTNEVLHILDETWRIIFVGDAAMAPSELTEIGGSNDFFHFNRRAGLEWLNDFRTKVPRSIWLNPDPVPYWGGSYTCQLLARFFPMFPLTVDGLHEAIASLRTA